MQQAEPQYPLTTNPEEEQWDDAPESEAAELHPPPLPVYAPHNLLQAHATLLDSPVVSLQRDTDAYRLVRTHFAILQKWHEQHTGWRIQRGPSFFRLERHLYRPASLFLDERLKRPRDFVCLAWILWFAEQRHLAGGGRNQQFLLSQLAEELQRQSQEASGVALDFRNLQDRYSMRRALEYLTQLGGLQALEGEVKQWEDAPDNEVLYEFTLISHSLIEAFHEQSITAMSRQIPAQRHALQLPDEATTKSVQNMPPLVRSWRTLLLGPALFRYDDAAAFAALVAQAEQVSDELAENFGWLLELNSDYACIVRGGTLSTGAGPTLTLNGAHDHMILLLCTELRKQVEQSLWSPDAYGCLHITSFDMNAIFSNLRQRYGSYWGASVKETKATDLLNEVYARMRLLGLMRGPDTEGQILILPTAARYSVSYTRSSIPAEGDSSEVQTPTTASTPRASRSRASRTATPGAAPQLAFEWNAPENPS